MANIIGNMIQNNMNITDEIIAGDMLTAAKGNANAYLNASLTSPTPELRAMYSSSLSQVLSGYNALSDLSINRGWEKPYNDPTQQLSEAYSKSKTTVES